MKISAIIINYNYAAYIERAILSVKNQTQPVDEIIIIDDGSTDNSLEVIKALKPKIPALRTYSKPNGGQLSAVRRGVEEASGEWIFFLDSDDEWLPAHIANAKESLAAHPEVSLYFSGHCESSGAALFRSKWPAGVVGPCAGLVAATGTRLGTIESTLGVRAEVARKVLSFERAIDSEWRMRAEDCLIFGASLSGAIAYYHSEQTVLYRIHGDNSFAHVDQPTEDFRYNANKASLFKYWMELFLIDPNGICDLIYQEFRSHPHNHRNAPLRRRSARVLFSAKKSRLKNIFRALRIQFLP